MSKLKKVFLILRVSEDFKKRIIKGALRAEINISEYIRRILDEKN